MKKGDSLFKIKAKAELNLTDIRAPFDGMVDRLREQLGSLIKEGDILTTLSDNGVMWAYFKVPEAQYLEYMASLKQGKEDRKSHSCWGTAKSSADARSVRSKANSTTKPGTSLSDGFPEPGRPAASRSGRHHPDPPNPA